MGLITKGVMNMPLPDDPAELGFVEWVQIKSRMRAAGAMLDRQEAEIEKLQEALRRYGDKSRMGTVYPESLQQAIDRAFGDTSTSI